ncbi:MAG TPA: N-acetylmuramoyl-L-alanine amidase [Jatrophihabitans sp.]|jgi:N-acetylmuramoyl-L-alanine amidase|uniref:N-acetylmuramoyl-L-alanine amidase n=1 Tax=Jatrophihabitans sp. TaxID=1932789 RepID=UPI002E08FE3F|nr:N-acetylmuramoyl-L-alanine amidase [Jatrophihabitans sp.]
MHHRLAVIVATTALLGGALVAVPPATAAAPTPTVTSVAPRHGSLAGGTRVRITGSAFSAASQVMFGSLAAASVHVSSSTLLYAVTPAHRSSRVDVRVRTAGGLSAPHYADSFFYSPAPQVVLDPGHDGGNASHPSIVNRLVYAGYGRYKACNTSGTATDAGYPEHAFTWDVTLRVRRILLAHGIEVVLTRSTDTGVGPCVNVRAAIESRRGTAVSVAIHADGAPSSGHGFHVNEDSRLPEHATTSTRTHSRWVSEFLHDALVRGSGLVPSTYLGTNGYVYRSDLAGLNLTTSPTAFLELGNMRNPGDAARLSSPTGRQRIASAVATGLLAYLGW